MTGYVYDSGALIAGDKRSARMLTVHRRALRAFGPPLLPGPVITQVWRGTARSVHMARILSQCEHVLSYSLEDYKRAGRILGEACLPGRKRPDAVDALVAVTAAIHQAGAIVTSDAPDIQAYLDALRYSCDIVQVLAREARERHHVHSVGLEICVCGLHVTCASVESKTVTHARTNS